MCRSDEPEATSPACGTGLGPDGNGWRSGWIIFYDQDGTGDRTSTNTVLRVQAALTQLDSVRQITSSSCPTSSVSTKIVFTATGRLKNMSSGMMTLRFGGSEFTSDLQRRVSISIGGQARIAGDGTATCG